MFPIKDHTQYRFAKKHGEPTYYSPFHLGYDLLCPTGTELFMAFDGEVIYKPGPESGECVWVRFDSQPGLTHRFMHLKKGTIKTGRRKEGEQIAVTNNTGKSSTAHLHHDTYRGQNPNPNDRKNFIDPLTLDWNPKPQPITFRVKLIANRSNWPSLQSKVDQIKDWYKNNSAGRILLEVDTEITQYTNIPFQDYNNKPEYFAWGIQQDWQIKHILPRAVGYDIVVVLLTPEDWNGPENQGVMLSDLSEQKTMVINLNSDEHTSGTMPLFVVLTIHEISHVLFALSARADPTHQYFYTPDYQDAPKIFNDLNYQTLSAVLAARRKEQYMPQIKTQGKGASRRIILEAGDLTEWKSLCKVFGKSPADKDLEEKVTG